MTWTLSHTTTWAGPVSAVAAGVVLQDGWANPENGFVESITAGNLLLNSAAGNQSPILRPTAPNIGDVLVDVVLSAADGFANHTVVLRKNGLGGLSTYYLFAFSGGDGVVYWDQYTTGPGLGEVGIHAFPFRAAFVSGNTFRLVCYVSGISVVEGGIFLRDTTAGVDLIGTTGANVNAITYERWTHEPEARLQVAGVTGLATAHADLFGPVSIYNDLAAQPDFPASRGRG